MPTRKLTDEELLLTGKKLVAALNELAQIKLRKKQFSAAIKEEEADATSLVTRYRREIDTGEIEIDAQLAFPQED